MVELMRRAPRMAVGAQDVTFGDLAVESIERATRSHEARDCRFLECWIAVIELKDEGISFTAHVARMSCQVAEQMLAITFLAGRSTRLDDVLVCQVVAVRGSLLIGF